MIAACPKCAARYRIAREKLGEAGVRLRCTQCEAVFKVRAPEEAAAAEVPAQAPASMPGAPAGAPPADTASQPAPTVDSRQGESPESPRSDSVPEGAPLVLVALPSEELAKQTADALVERGLRAAVVHDGVEAMLETQRQLPQAVVLSATLPRMYGFQVCEVVKRNESLRSTLVVLAGAVHHQGRYRRPPEELYGADAYLEEPDLPEALLPLLVERGLAPAGPAVEPQRPQVPVQPDSVDPVDPVPEPPAAAGVVPAPPVASPQAPPDAPPVASTAAPPAADDGLGEERTKADRLARIIVSDIVLYNEEKFTAAVQAGNVAQALAGELDEGRCLFRGRVDERVRDETDHLMDELLRVARARGMA